MSNERTFEAIIKMDRVMLRRSILGLRITMDALGHVMDQYPDVPGIKQEYNFRMDVIVSEYAQREYQKAVAS